MSKFQFVWPYEVRNVERTPDFEPLTNEYLSQVQLRHKSASGGVWEAELGEVTNGHPTWRIGDFIQFEDAEFVAHAHQDIPRLLTEIERLRANYE
jgi:hypothetical protein